MAARQDGEVIPSGIYTMPAERYHADPAPEPSLSAGTAHRLVNRSPLHAWYGHPRLNPDYREEVAAHLDFGTAAHSILLDGVDRCVEIAGFEDWRKQDARDQRDLARAEDRIPLLTKDLERMRELCSAVASQLSSFELDPLPLRDGQPEQTLIWQEDGVWCRARLDWLHDTGDVVDDLKTTSASANPLAWARNRLFADGKDIQCAFYRRGLRALTGVDADWRFVVCEVEPPYALSVISLASSALELAERKVERAIELWRRCLEEDHWPGYPTEVAYAEAPPWEEARFLEAHYEQEIAA